MLEDYCSECNFRQSPVGQPISQTSPQGLNQPMQMPTSTYQQPMMGGGMYGGTTGGTTMFGAPLGGSPMFGTPAQGSQMPGGLQQMMEPSPVPGVNFISAPGSPVIQDIGYTQGFLRSQIGRFVRIEFLIGTNSLTDRTGTLLDVGISYIVLRETESDDLLMCDIYSIKFVRVYL